VEAYATRSGGGRNTHAAPKDFGTRSSAGVRAESTNYSSSLPDSIVFECNFSLRHLAYFSNVSASVVGEHARHRTRGLNSVLCARIFKCGSIRGRTPYF
jgi:hypothetical protein